MEANTDKRYPPPNTDQINKFNKDGKTILEDLPKNTKRSNNNRKKKNDYPKTENDNNKN